MYVTTRPVEVHGKGMAMPWAFLVRNIRIMTDPRHTWKVVEKFMAVVLEKFMTYDEGS